MAKVTLIAWTQNPLQVIHAMTQNMAGNVITDLSQVDEAEALETVAQLRKTSLQGPFEFVNFVFQIEGVPRALTHQLVRTRIGSYSQESLRFVVKTGDLFQYDLPLGVYANPVLKAQYMGAMKEIGKAYNSLIEAGAKPEDARGVLPINVLTNIGVKWDLKTLIGIAEVRLCYQSQAHWRSVIEQIKQEIAEKVDPAIADLLNPYCENHDGRCGFLSIYDRKCPRQSGE
jgi:thymidylate synthase (FAD)